MDQLRPGKRAAEQDNATRILTTRKCCGAGCGGEGRKTEQGRSETTKQTDECRLSQHQKTQCSGREQFEIGSAQPQEHAPAQRCDGATEQ
jgi:hypothetical protein